MDMGTCLVGTDLFGTLIKSQSQISLSIYYSKSGHGEDPEGGFTNPCKVVAMLGRRCVCGGTEIPGGSVRMPFGYWLRHLLDKVLLLSSPTVLCLT